MLYLQNNKILKGFKTEINCHEDDLESIVIINATEILHRTGNGSGIYNSVKTNTFIYKTVNGVSNDFSRMNFNHFDMLLRTEDNPQTFLEALNSIDEHDSFHEITGNSESTLDLN